MITVLLGLLALVIAEAAALAGVRIVKAVRELKNEGGAAPPKSGQEPGEDFEKRWREGMDAMMGYDLAAARRAAGRDEHEN